MKLSSQPDVLVVEDLWKSFGPRHALQGLTFSLKAGRILGLLGPKDSGKTTSIRILTTKLEPESGHFMIEGVSSRHPEQIRRKIGVLPENLDVASQMTGLEYMTDYGDSFGLESSEARQNAQILIDVVGLHQRSKSQIDSYGQGMQLRLGIACALLNDPVVMFLDEPTLRLDAHDQRDLLELIRKIARDRNIAVVLSTQLLTEVERICDDLVILNLGQTVARGQVEDVIGRAQKNIRSLNMMRVYVPPAAVLETRQVLEGMPNILKLTRINEVEGWLDMGLVPASKNNPINTYQVNNTILRALIRAKIPIISFAPEDRGAQDVFLNLAVEGIK